MDVLAKTFLQIILAAKWLVRHSSTSPKQQQRPLPSLRFVFSSSICIPAILGQYEALLGDEKSGTTNALAVLKAYCSVKPEVKFKFFNVSFWTAYLKILNVKPNFRYLHYTFAVYKKFQVAILQSMYFYICSSIFPQF